MPLSMDAPMMNATEFRRRFAFHSLGVWAVLLGSLLAGMLGYRFLGGPMSWVDAFLNASMILSGMGPVAGSAMSSAGKLFSGFYALYSGVLFISVFAWLSAPILHRSLKRFHLGPDESPDAN